MALSVGTRLGPYEVLAQIGAGGMGEVYRARDTKLDRDVAIKVLPEAFAADAERVARFEREAKTLASLNHPHIAAIYGIEENGGARALVMELVEGEDLSQRIARRAIPLDEALPIAKQIAEALDAAHEQGIIHRDLKPANIKVREDGTVKVLDLGLAKLAQGSGPKAQDRDATMSPTITSPTMMTGVGVLLGTAAYMSPEQAKGREADKRSDIWAFGCVVFEMLTGARAFDGEDLTEVLASVVRSEPDWTALPSTVPPPVGALLRGCLAKDRRKRIADISTALFVLEQTPTLLSPRGAMPTLPVQSTSWRRVVALGVGALTIAGMATALTWVVMRPASAALVRLTVTPRESTQLGITTTWPDIAISPDGRRIAYIAGTGTGSRLYLRPLDQLAEVPLAPASDADNPFFSPDGNWIGFVEGLTTLKKVAASGGPPVTITGLQGRQPRGASWGPDDEIVFATEDPATGLLRVPSRGGTPTVMTRPETGMDHYFPEVLPGGRGVLFTIAPSTEGFVTGATRGSDPAPAQIAVLDLRSGEQRVLVNGGSNAHYVATGHLVYAVAGTLRAVQFDLDRLAVSGDPVPVVNQVITKATGAANFAVSISGTLAYQEGVSATAAAKLVWMDREGHEDPIAAPPRAYTTAFLSPDGTRIALDTRDQASDIWIWSLPRQTLTRLTFDPGPDPGGIWSPGGRRVAFARASDGGNIYWQAADGTGVAERLTQRTKAQRPSSFTQDGKFLLFSEPATGPRDIGIVALDGERKSELLLQTPFDELNAEVSPDGRWMAYQSNESGQTEVYVRPFPNVNAGRWQVSTSGGVRPTWARNGRELFYVSGARQITAVPVKSGATFEFGNPTVLFERAYNAPTDARNYDVSPDGRRFLIITDSTQTSAPSQLNVVLNWGDELKRLVR